QIESSTIINANNFYQFSEWLRTQELFFHGTSSTAIDNIRENGISREFSTVRPEEWLLFSKLHERVHGTKPPLSNDRTEDRIFLTGKASNAMFYPESAKGGEAANIFLREYTALIESGQMSDTEAQSLRDTAARINSEIKDAKPATIAIHGSVLDKLVTKPGQSSESAKIETLAEVFRWVCELNEIPFDQGIRADLFLDALRVYYDNEIVVTEVSPEMIGSVYYEYSKLPKTKTIVIRDRTEVTNEATTEKEIDIHELLVSTSQSATEALLAANITSDPNLSPRMKAITGLWQLHLQLRTLQSIHPDRAFELENIIAARSRLSELLNTIFESQDLSLTTRGLLADALTNELQSFQQELTKALPIINELKQGVDFSAKLTELLEILPSRTQKAKKKAPSPTTLTQETKAAINNFPDFYNQFGINEEYSYGNIYCEFDDDFQHYLHVTEAYVPLNIDGRIRIVRIASLIDSLNQNEKGNLKVEFYDYITPNMVKDELDMGDDFETIAADMDESVISIDVADLKETTDGFYQLPLSPYFNVEASLNQEIEYRTTPWLTIEVKPPLGSDRVSLIVKKIDDGGVRAHPKAKEFRSLIGKLQIELITAEHLDETSQAALEIALEVKDKSMTEALKLLLDSQRNRYAYTSDPEIQKLLKICSPYNHEFTLGLEAGDCKELALNEALLFTAASVPTILLAGPSTVSNYDENTDLEELRYEQMIDPATTFANPGHMQPALLLNNNVFITEPTRRRNAKRGLDLSKIDLEETARRLTVAVSTDDRAMVFEIAKEIKQLATIEIENKASGSYAMDDPLAAITEKKKLGLNALISTAEKSIIAIIKSDKTTDIKKVEIINILKQFIRDSSKNLLTVTSPEYLKFTRFARKIISNLALSENKYSSELLDEFYY
nr:hypothetical protein [Pseudomonadota bacterium]